MPEEARPLIPVRMLSEYAYCPRVMYLMWVEGTWAESPDTVEGRQAHRGVDRPDQELADPSVNSDVPRSVRSLALSNDGLGLTGRLDLLDLHDGVATPIEYKVGNGPPTGGAWDADVVQVVAQALLLRASGYRCDEGAVYYVASRSKVPIPVTDDRVNTVLALRDALWADAERPVPPPPLVDSPKCPRCSMVGICLPDEVVELQASTSSTPPSLRKDQIRRLLVARPEQVPLYVTTQGAVIRKTGDRLRVTKGTDTLIEARVADVSAVSVFGNVEVSTPAAAAMLAAGIPILYFSYGGWFRGMTSGALAQNAPMRQAQYGASLDPDQRLRAGGWIISAKIHNQRLVIRRNAANHPALPALARASKGARGATSTDSLLGLEGQAARLYFEAFGSLLPDQKEFAWESRNRRPPRDPVNSLLSYVYALLLKDCLAAAYSVGLDPYVGLLHSTGYGKPALALDLMEAYRPVVGDSTVLGMLNRHMVTRDDFVVSSRGVAIKDGPRRAVVESYERRMDSLFEHPLFGYQVSYRRAMEIDARLLGRYVQGELTTLPVLRMR